METIELMQGDCRERMREIPDNSVDAVITDPPYELGFMGKTWDSSGIAYDVDMWKECLRVLKPGGYLLSFGGTRTYHRMACAIEDAGFEIRDMIEWVYGSGFPKSLNISKAMEGVIGKQGKGFKSAGDDGRKAEFKQDLSKRSDYGYVWKPTNENAKQWEGWGTALKPAHEPICLARKPLSEKTVAKNVLKWGTGGINIDESRVGTDKITINGGGGGEGTGWGKKEEINEERIGRFPANLIHDGSEEVKDCFPETKSGGAQKGSTIKSKGGGYRTDIGKVNKQIGFKDYGGNASRYFKSIKYCPKASKKERGEGNNHPTVKPVALMEYLVIMFSKEGQTVLDPFMGSGTTGVACATTGRSFIGIELGEED